MNLKEQKYICTLAKCGSITKAANELFISQPALSSYVKGIETSLGVPLFVRDEKQLRLTYAGELYVKKAEQMLAMQQEYHNEVQNILRGTKGKISIGMQRRRGPYLVVEILRQFKEFYPEIDLEFSLGTSNNLYDAYENGKIDILIANQTETPAGSVNQFLMNERILLVMDRKNPVQEKSCYFAEGGFRWIDLYDVRNETFILPEKNQSLRRLCDRAMKSTGIHPQKVFEIGHIDTAMQMAASGFGVAFSRESYATQFQYEKRPIFLLVGNPLVEEALCVLYRKEAAGNPRIVKLVEIINHVVQNTLATHLL